MSLVAGLALLSTAFADPCGMVPPIWTGQGPAPVSIERTGLQQTYMFHRDGVQTIAIRPGFKGDAEQFGMLVPLPSVPALRKIDDRTFEHLRAAVDPPELRVESSNSRVLTKAFLDRIPAGRSYQSAVTLAPGTVNVVKEEAVGMYEVAVLEAGSSQALRKWMDNNEFRYPDGMDEVVDDYVELRWMFVAIKARVAGASGVSAKPGMRKVDDRLGSGESFDGFVQGMAFRFEVDEPVIPMRLSTFNGGDTHNRVYLLTDSPVRLAEVSASTVRRQVGGSTLHGNLTGLLPMRVHGVALGKDQIAELEAKRNPDPYTAVARDLFAGDLLAAARGELSLPFEEREKELLRINEGLNLRGAATDQLVEQTMVDARVEAVEPALSDLYEMTLTVLDGEFPRSVLRKDNLHVAEWTLPDARNRLEVWNDRPEGPIAYVYVPDESRR